MRKTTIVAFNSQKPGVGKSFITKEVTAKLAEKQPKAKILVIDVDEQNFSQGKAFGIQDSGMKHFNLISVLQGLEKNNFELNLEDFQDGLFTCERNESLKRTLENVKILPMRPEDFDKRYKVDRVTFLKFFKLIKGEFDYIIIDTNSNFYINILTTASLEVSQAIFQITDTDINSIRATLKNITTIAKREEKNNTSNIYNKTRLIINQVPESFAYVESEEIFQETINKLKKLCKGKMFKVSTLPKENLNLAIRYSFFLSIRKIVKKRLFRSDVLEYEFPQFERDINAISNLIINLNKVEDNK